MLVTMLNYLDRGLMILLLQPIKEDLLLSDTQLGFLTGIAFGLFYAVLGLPIARWSDRGDRVTITAIAIGLWGATVMSCVFVTNFIQLVCARVAAGIGESGSVPPTYSLVGDYFPQAAERARAMAVYMVAGPLSALFSFVLGGWLSERYGWRMTFVLMGIPALLIAALVKWTIVEPRRARARELPGARAAPGMREVFRTIWYRRSSRNLCMALVLLWTVGLGLSPWYATFLMRTHGMGTTELGMWLGLIFGASGAIGIIAGGFVAARWFSSDERGQMQLSAIMVSLLAPFYVLFLLLPQKQAALLSLAPLILISNLFVAPTLALMQRLVSDQMRATTLAIVMLLSNLIGMGLAPQLVGALSDVLAHIVGGESLRYAMLAVSFVGLWSAYHFWRVSQTVEEDLAQMRARL